MTPLTPQFIEQLGFKVTGVTYEQDFHYKDYTSPGFEESLTIFFTYFNNGKVTCNVEAFGEYLLHNVGEEELLVLIKVLSPSTLNSEL